MFQSASVHIIFRLFVLFLRFAIINFQFSILTACSFGDEPGLCPYNVKMEYWYAGSSTENMLPVYVDNIRQYLFDDTGRLLSDVTLRGDSIGGWNGNLPDGTYTLVLWGNLNEEGKEATQVKTENDYHMEEMTLSAVTEGVPPGYRDNTGRLYYGTITFTIGHGGTEHHRVYLSHAHASLNITVLWRTEEQPPIDGVWRMRLKGIPAIYNFTGGIEETIPSGNGIYTIPRSEKTVTYHETRAAMNYDHEVTGQFVTFRYTSGSHELWSLWRNGEQVIRDLDLARFFARLPMDMDRNMEQEFELMITVYENEIIVTQTTASDWTEGGSIG